MTYTRTNIRDRIIDNAEDLGWSVSFGTQTRIDPVTQEQVEESYAEFERYSPAGEDFGFTVFFDMDEDITREVSSYAEDFDIEENLFRFLPFDALYKRWAQSNVMLYTGHCNSVEAGDARVPMAKSCVEDIVAKADECIATGAYCADLRFGHDYPLMALVSYLGIEGVGERIPADQICDR